MGKLVVVGEVLEAVEGLRESNYVGRWLALADDRGEGRRTYQPLLRLWFSVGDCRCDVVVVETKE